MSSSSSSSIPTDPWQALSPSLALRGARGSQAVEHPAFQGLMPAAASPIPPSRHFPSLCLDSTWEWSGHPQTTHPAVRELRIREGKPREDQSTAFPSPGAPNVQAD